LELFEYTLLQYPQAGQEWLSRLEQISEQQIDLILHAFPAGRLSEAAANFAFKILLTNKERLLSLLNL
jgi:hypothetical protein